VNEFGLYLSNPLGGLILGFFPNGRRWLPLQFLHHYRAIAFGGRFAIALGGILENGLFGAIIVVWI
jgi:hypothetical protein